MKSSRELPVPPRIRTTSAFVIALAILLSPHAANGQIRQVALPTNDLIYDPVTQRIYASVPSRAGTLGNTVTAIDPLTGNIGPSVFVGSEPAKLALSEDGQFLYVALEGAAAVRRIQLPALTAGLQFQLGSSSFSGPFYAEDMEVLPGNARAIAISRRDASRNHRGVAIYDDGIQRPTVTSDSAGSTRIEFSASAARLYGLAPSDLRASSRRAFSSQDPLLLGDRCVDPILDRALLLFGGPVNWSVDTSWRSG